MDYIPLTKASQFHITHPDNAKINKVKQGIGIMKKYLCIYISVFLLLNIVGCGTKGPLYIPEKKYPQDTTPEKK
jgi:predicted small lipoprotein YifL